MENEKLYVTKETIEQSTDISDTQPCTFKILEEAIRLNKWEDLEVTIVGEDNIKTITKDQSCWIDFCFRLKGNKQFGKGTMVSLEGLYKLLFNRG